MFVRKGETLTLNPTQPTLLIVVRGVARVEKPRRMELGPCTMLYLPGGTPAVVQAPWEDVELYEMPSYDLGPEPRILYNGYGVKSPEGHAALCVRVEKDGTRLLLPAKVYTVTSPLLVQDEEGNTKPVEHGEELRPPAKLLPGNGAKRAFALLILSAR